MLPYPISMSAIKLTLVSFFVSDGTAELVNNVININDFQNLPENNNEFLKILQESNFTTVLTSNL